MTRYSHRSLIGDPPLLLARLTFGLPPPAMGMFSLLAPALEKYETTLVGARVALESEKMERFLLDSFEEGLERAFFFKGSEEEADTSFDNFEVLTRRGIDDAVAVADGMVFLARAGRGLVGDIITS